MSLLQLFARQLQVHGVSPGQRVAVAVSGGSDSLALALLTAWWRGHGGIPEPLASVSPNQALSAEAELARRPPEELLYLAQAILQRRDAAAGSASSTADPQDAPWAVLQRDIQIAAGFPVNTAAAPEPAYAVIVDHALRPESAAEAAATAETVAAWGLQPLVLTAEWPDSKPRRGSIMKAARLLRQQVYQQACSQHGISDLLLGHQSGDQAETFLLRLSRASGIVGLTGMMSAWRLSMDHPDSCIPGPRPGPGPGAPGSSDAPVHGLTAQQVSGGGGSNVDSGDGGGGGGGLQPHSVRVLRPLLGVDRGQLQALLRRCGVAWVDDPTNADTYYSRNAIRALLFQRYSQQQAPPPELSASQPGGSLHRQPSADSGADSGDLPGSAADLSGLPAADATDPAVVRDMLRLQRRCAATFAEMQRQSEVLLAACAPQYLQLGRTPGTLALALQPLQSAQRSPAMHVLTAILQAVSGAHKPPNRQQVSKLLRLLTSGDVPPVARFTPLGCRIAALPRPRGTEVVLVVPEAAAQQQQQQQQQQQRRRLTSRESRPAAQLQRRRPTPWEPRPRDDRQDGHGLIAAQYTLAPGGSA